MSKNYFLFIFLVLSSFNVLGQIMNLGKVTVDELKQKSHPHDSSAVAAILYKKCRIQYNNSLGQIYTETEVKIKIYKKEGYDYANVKQRYYNGNGASVSFTDVATYNLLNGQVVKTKLKKEGEFKEEITKDLYQKKIVLSDVKEGSIIEYKIKRYSNNGFRLVDIFLQEAIPVDDIELKVEHSDRYYYSKSVTGYFTPQMTEEKFDDINSNKNLHLPCLNVLN